MAAVVILLYLGYMFIHLNELPEVTCLKPLPGCQNLDLSWLSTSWAGLLYNGAALAIVLLMGGEYTYVQYLTAYLVASYAFSAKFFYCGRGSVWCWFTALLPLVARIIA